MAVTTNPNAVFISYSGIGNETVKKFIAMLDEKRIPHRDSESEFIQDELTDFEEKIGMANIIVIFYSPDYFKKEHCMNEYANIRKCENKERKAATYYVKCENFKFADILKELKREWGGNFAEWKDEKHENLKPITQLSMANGCYIDENTPYCVQKLDNYFSKKIRFTESNLQDLVELIEKKYCKLSSKKTPVIQEIPIVAAPHFTFSVPDGLMQREDEEENLFNLISKNRIVNLVGVGGSGKSSLAYLCLNRHKDDFNEISFVVVNNNIKDDIVDQLNKTLKLEFEEDAYTEIITFLQENYQSDKPNLLALDINETADKDKTTEYINEILQDTAYLAGWKILILSRENVDTRNRIKTHNLNDKEDFDFLKKLFLEKAGARYSEFSDFAGLFNVIYYNPLLAEQLGWYLNSYPKTATLDDIKKILYGSLGEQEMQGMSAAQRHDENVNTFLKNLIVYDNLEENEQKLLRHFVLWQSEYIEYDVIADLLKGVFESEDELINTLTSLSKRSILTTNNEDTLSYKLHGLLANSLREQIKIENEDYDEYLWNIYRIIAYGYYKFVPFVDCIGNSLCEYDITNNNATLHNVALKYYNSWKANYSEKLYNKAIKICLKKLTSDKDNATYQNDLASAYNCLAILQKNHLRDYDSAKANYEKAIAIRKQLPKDNPQYQNDLANTYNNLANLQKDNLGEYELSKSNYEKAITIRVQLPKDNPEYQNDLANAYNNLAILLNKQKKYESAELNINSAIAIHQRLSDLNPKFLIDFLNSKYLLASIYVSRRKTNTLLKAHEILDEIKPLAEKCLSDNPNDSRAQTLNKNINNLSDLRVKAERIYKGCIIFLVIAIILTAILWYVLR